MELALDDRIPNFAGGLGVLASDTIYAAADLGVRLVGVSLLYHVDDDPELAFSPQKIMKRCRKTITVDIEDRKVKIIIWKMIISGQRGHRIPIFFLSTNDQKNKRWDRDLTKNLYASDAYTRLGQEVILGIGGVRALKVLGYNITHYHINEGHAALLTLEKLKECKGDIDTVRSQCSFTTHTAIDSGHDYFDHSLVDKVLTGYLPEKIRELSPNKCLGMTELALHLSGRANAVSQIHKQVCERKFPGHKFEFITNGIYHRRWIGKHIKKLLDSQIPGWQSAPDKLLSVLKSLPSKKLLSARQAEKKDFTNWINKHKSFLPINNVATVDQFNPRILTVGFARRLVPYKRPDLIFRDINRLQNIGYKKLQLVFAGNCYNDDYFSNNLIAVIRKHAQELRGKLKIALIPEYNLHTGQRLVAGCDLWLNNPTPGSEASGTSGMKAALNGVPNLSTMDGWWIEAYKSDVRSGWGFGEFVDSPDRNESDYNQLMNNLENIIDCYYNRREEWLEKMIHSIALIAYFNTYRMVNEYVAKMWNGQC